METKLQKKVDYKFLMAIIASTLLVIFSTTYLFCSKFDLIADDYLFHANRIVGFANSLRAGVFPVKYYSNFLSGGGYFSPIFYGDIFFFFPAILVIIGFSPAAAFFIFVYMIVAALAISMYFLLKLFIKNRLLCVAGATYFVLSQYIFVDVFFRGALGECLGIIFLIILIIGMHNMLKQNFSKPWILSIAFLGLLFSHMTSLVLGAIMLVLTVLFNAKKLFPDKKFWLKALFAFTIFLAVGLYFICSFIELYFSDKFAIAEPWTYVSENTLSISGLLYKSPYGTGLLVFLPLVLRCFLFKKDRFSDDEQSKIKTCDKFMIISYILVFLTLDFIPWKYLDNYLTFLQFPWRFFAITHILLAIVIFTELSIIAKTQVSKMCCMALLAALASYFILYNNLMLFHKDYVRPDVYWLSLNFRYEWTPLCVSENTICGEVVDDSGKPVSFDRKKYDTAVTFTASPEAKEYIVPIIYYKGYSAYLVDGKTKTKLEVYQTKDGNVAVKTNNVSGTIVVYYKGTATQLVTMIISSVLTIAIISAAAVRYAKGKRKQRQITSENATG